MSNENFILHEWEKEQLDALVEDEKKKRLIQEGIEQGLEQGSKQEKLEIAKNMLVEKINIETISKVTNLSKAEIEKLK